MSEEKKRGGSMPPTDQYVADLAAAGIEQGADVEMIVGLVGESPRAQYVRLFTNPDLSECLDIPEDAIHFHKPLDSPFGGSTLYVDSKARLLRVRIDSVDAEAAFLDGDMVADVLPNLQDGDFDFQAGLISTPICSIITISIIIVSAVSKATCDKKTSKNCIFTAQRQCR